MTSDIKIVIFLAVEEPPDVDLIGVSFEDVNGAFCAA
jgi:hypothetical protein